jgi:hypothetical protein
MGCLYHINRTNTARFALGTAGHFPLICFGLNPSFAEPDNLDPTTKSVERIAQHQNYNSWVMINLYPQRATKPKNLHAYYDQSLHKTNLKHIENVLIFGEPLIWAAWGANITVRTYLLDCLWDIYKLAEEYDCSWIRIGDLTKNGHPQHPLYLRKDAEKTEFDVEGYLKKLSKQMS